MQQTCNFLAKTATSQQRSTIEMAFKQEDFDSLRHREASLAEELKNLCDEDGREADVTKSAKIIHHLGVVYRQRSPDKIALVRSAVLYVAALVRKPDDSDKILAALNDLGCHLLKLADAKCTVAMLAEKVSEVTWQVYDMRKRAQTKLQEIDQLLDSEFAGRQKKIDLMESLQLDLCKSYTKIMNGIMNFCISAKGKPPCKYALAGMGSLARKDITPYSDFEHVILLEDAVQSQPGYENILEYFRWLSVLFQFVIVCLGETMIPCINLPCLKDWFYDGFTNRGICFDGMIPHACKFPLGRPATPTKPWSTELIKPVREMLLYLECDEDLKNGYHLADVLNKTCFVSGSTVVYEEFRNGVTEYHQKLTCYQLRKQVAEDVRLFNPISSLTNSERQLNIKRVVFRTTTVFISTLARFYNLEAGSNFDVVRDLGRRGKLDHEFVHCLLYSNAIACEVRLQLYLRRQRQDDCFDGSHSSDDLEIPIVQLMGPTPAVVYFQSAIKLQRFVCETIGLKCNPYIQQIAQLDKLLTCFWLRLREGAMLEAEKLLSAPFQQGKNASVALAIVSEIGEYFFRQGSMTKAFKCYQLLDCTFHSKEHAAFCLNRKARCLQYNRKFQEALQLFMKELSIRKQIPGTNSYNTDPDILFCYSNIGMCYFDLKVYDKAVEYFNVAKTVSQTLEPFKSTEEIADCENMIAKCMFEQMRYAAALEHHGKELKIRQDICGLDVGAAVNADIARCCFEYAQTYFVLSDFSKALDLYAKSRTIWSLLATAKALPASKSMQLKTPNKSRCGLTKHQHSGEYLEEEFVISTEVSDEKRYPLSISDEHCVEHRNVQLHEINVPLHVNTNSTKTLDVGVEIQSEREVEQRDVSTEQHRQAIPQIETGKSKQIPPLCVNCVPGCCSTFSSVAEECSSMEADETDAFKCNIAVCTKMIGRCLFQLKRYQEATECFEQELRVRKQVSREQTTDPAIALCFVNKAGCLLKLGQVVEAINLLETAINIYARSTEAVAQNNLPECLRMVGVCLFEEKRYQEAMTQFQRELEMRDVTHRNEDSQRSFKELVQCLSINGKCLLCMKQYEKALKHYEDELSIRERDCERSAADRVAFCLLNIAQCHVGLKRFREAVGVCGKAKTIWKAVGRKGGGTQAAGSKIAAKNTAVCFQIIGECLNELKQHSDAIKQFKKELYIRKRVSADQSADQDIARCSTMIGVAYFELHMHEKALKYFRLAERIYSNCSGRNAKINFAECIKMAGLCLYGLEKYDEAIREFYDELNFRMEHVAVDTAIALCHSNLDFCRRRLL